MDHSSNSMNRIINDFYNTTLIQDILILENIIDKYI